MSKSQLPYNPELLPRELKKHYIGMDQAQEKKALDTLGKKSLEDLFSHIPQSVRMDKNSPLKFKGYEYSQLVQHLQEINNQSSAPTSFIGDGLGDFQVPATTEFVCSLRGLTTAYTPYQPERCQGTLQSLWVYSNTMAALTGMEAINASLYDRATCLYEALQSAVRSKKDKQTVLVSEGIYPGDLEVLKTHAAHTKLKIVTVPLCPKTGLIDQEKLQQLLQQHQEHIAAYAFTQVNNLGLLEDVHAASDFCSQHHLTSIAVIDPILLGEKGLIPPSQYGSQKQGVDMIVGEGQHLALAPLFGGPGLGLFGIRYNENDKNSIRSSAGRYVGLGQDKFGHEALCLVLSTREQHIRREKATSNICSNQSFVATLVGAAMLARGDEGLTQLACHVQEMAHYLASEITAKSSFELAFKESAFFNQVAFFVPENATSVIEKAAKANLLIGVDITTRFSNQRPCLLISCSDRHQKSDIDKLVAFIQTHWKKEDQRAQKIPTLNSSWKRSDKIGLPQLGLQEIKDFYQKLDKLNVGPDDNLYPLGSCTMKYNPYVNDWAAALPNLSALHPQAPLSQAQGHLHIFYEIQEMFKQITGLAAVTTQPVAGAQGELVGLKMFQAYHHAHGEGESRDIIIIPRSAHGTNPATATMAGIETVTLAGKEKGIVTVDAGEDGTIDLEKLKVLIDKYAKRLIGIMITNPNTSGLFETSFEQVANWVHQAGGLVYMDGANMNAIAGWVDLKKLGVDAVHNNLHKTWSIPHGGGGPGDAIVAVSDKLVDFLPGVQVRKDSAGKYEVFRPQKSIGSFHRHWGNFAHKVRCYTYLKALGAQGVVRMSGVAVLAANYLYHRLGKVFPILPQNTQNSARMHEFIITLNKETFLKLEQHGTPKAQAIARIGKLFLDFGLHAPTVAFPEIYGLMIEPTETYELKELDHFCDVVFGIGRLLQEHPEVLTTAPHFTPVAKIDEVLANKNLVLEKKLKKLPTLPSNVHDPVVLGHKAVDEVMQMIVRAHQEQV